MSSITRFSDLSTAHSHCAAADGMADRFKETYSSVESDDSTLTYITGLESVSTLAYPAPLDPRTAGDRIARFLKQRVRISKALNEYRIACIEKREVERPDKLCFTVETVPPEKYSEIRKVIDSWKEMIDEFSERSDLTAKDDSQLASAMFLLLSLDADLSLATVLKKKGKHKRTSLVIAKDIAGKIQAMVFIERAHKPVAASMAFDYHIDTLITAPSNLKLSFQRDCLSGSATALIEEVVFKSLRYTAKRAVILASLASSVTFYERLGFARTDSSKFILEKINLLKFLSNSGGIALLSR